MESSWLNTALIILILDWLIKLLCLFYIPRNRKPSAAIAWILVIFLIPWVGFLLFFLIGSPKLSKRRRNIQKQIDSLIEAATASNQSPRQHFDKNQRARYNQVTRLGEQLGKLPVRDGNTVKILPEYDKAILDILHEINQAKEFIHLEYFIVALDNTTQPIFDALESAIKRGVKVRILIDALGYRRYPKRRELRQLLTNIGASWHFMLPIRLKPGFYNRPDLRNHRKIVVIDDNAAYMGSQNLIDRTYHRKDGIYYDELVAKLTGPIVRHCAVIFASDWLSETGELLTKIVDPRMRPLPQPTGNVHAQILPSGPAFELDNNAALFTYLFHLANKRIFITNPYFIPNEAMMDAIIAAAARGVEVIMINSEVMDQWMVGHAQRSFYPELVKSGIKIYLYNAPILLHSKHITIDDDIAIIGSSNLDIRSFELNLESTLIAYDKSVVKDLQKVQKRDIKNSTQLNLKQWEKRSTYEKFLDSIARLTSSLQ